MILYISIGNSDDKLTQSEWAEFQQLVAVALASRAQRWHGEWVSEARSRFQNACWCVEVDEATYPLMKKQLSGLAHTYRQDSVAVAFCDHTEFVG